MCLLGLSRESDHGIVKSEASLQPEFLSDLLSAMDEHPRCVPKGRFPGVMSGLFRFSITATRSVFTHRVSLLYRLSPAIPLDLCRITQV
jgi:hypothetical protein